MAIIKMVVHIEDSEETYDSNYRREWEHARNILGGEWKILYPQRNELWKENVRFHDFGRFRDYPFISPSDCEFKSRTICFFKIPASIYDFRYYCDHNFSRERRRTLVMSLTTGLSFSVLETGLSLSDVDDKFVFVCR